MRTFVPSTNDVAISVGRGARDSWAQCLSLGKQNVLADAVRVHLIANGRIGGSLDSNRSSILRIRSILRHGTFHISHDFTLFDHVFIFMLIVPCYVIVLDMLSHIYHECCLYFCLPGALVPVLPTSLLKFRLLAVSL